MNFIFARFKEPSTWAGMAALFPSLLAVIAAPNPANIGGVVAGVAAILMPESSHA